jgi:hypothetical protein
MILYVFQTFCCSAAKTEGIVELLPFIEIDCHL